MGKALKKPVRIMVCADGIVIVIDNPRQYRRLGSALPCYAVSDVDTAFKLIQEVCYLIRVNHGKKTGLLVEFKAPNWPRWESVQDISYIDRLADIFQCAEAMMKPAVEIRLPSWAKKRMKRMKRD